MSKQKKITTIRTSIKDRSFLFVSETVSEVNTLLQDKNKFMVLNEKNKINKSARASKIIIPKSVVKLVSSTWVRMN